MLSRGDSQCKGPGPVTRLVRLKNRGEPPWLVFGEQRGRGGVREAGGAWSPRPLHGGEA